MRALLTAILLLTLVPAGATASGLGQARGTAGCVASTGSGCVSVKAAREVAGLAVSPDGRHLYAVAQNADAVLAFARDQRSGAARARSPSAATAGSSTWGRPTASRSCA